MKIQNVILMVTTRSGKLTNAKTQRRYPKCRRHANGGVKCVACFRAGKTEEELEKLIGSCRSKKLSIPRPLTRVAHPKKKLLAATGRKTKNIKRANNVQYE